ncbi:MAG: glycoside hydrolase family 15 [Actinomycetota bacterium]|jgi:GH15 family glucan-1,4-alpha-glucosidase|nr:glycoside hydrolase family 15 [Actinomycetota bacterium]
MPRTTRYFAGVVAAILLGAGAVSYTPTEDRIYPAPVPLRVSGLIGNSSGNVAPVSPEEAEGASYLPESNVLRLLDGNLRYVPETAEAPVTAAPEDDGAMESVAETRAWLASGHVPGASGAEKEISARSLLNLRLLSAPDGASLAAMNEGWDYVWPRDASWVSSAFSATGHHGESYETLRFLAKIQKEDGTWEARYHADGSPVLDGRAAQLDANGWFLWAVWFHAETSPDGAESVENLWPSVERAADAASNSLGADGLPPGGADYWEIPTLMPNLGTAAPLLAGLRASANLAEELGYAEEAARYRDAAARLDSAIERDFAPNGYTRTIRPSSGRDSAIAFLAPPFGKYDPGLAQGIRETEKTLTIPNGGVVPGERWPQEPTVSWTPETAFFMLAASSSGDEERAERILGWLAAHRTGLGAFPEKVDGGGAPQAAAPLAWTEAMVVLSLAAEEKPLPIPPAS